MDLFEKQLLDISILVLEKKNTINAQAE